MGRPRVLLADDHPLVLEGISKLVGETCDVVGTVEDGRALIEAAERLNPDLVLLDISMPLLNGLDAARQVKAMLPACRIIFLTMHADPAYALEAMEAGGSGYLLKRSAASELAQALEAVLGGRQYITPLIRPDPQATFQRESTRDLPSVKTLTPRQREVLQLIVEGKSTKAMASILSISLKTVEFHKSNLMERVGVHTTAELIHYAVVHGLTP